jgi:hypothetical protein
MWWQEAAVALFHTEALPFAMVNREALQVIVFRLANTHPKHIVPAFEINQDTGIIRFPTRIAKAFWAACCYLGTLF